MSEISISHTNGKVVKEAKAIVDRYVVFLKSNEYDNVGSERFGANLIEFIDEPKTEETYKAIRRRIVNQTKNKFPEVQIESMTFRQTTNKTVQIDMSIVVIPTGTKINFIIDA